MPESVAAPTLAELQSSFQRFVLDGTDEIGSKVIAADPESGAKRLAIYSDGYAQRLDEALRADYRGLHAMLGDAEFGRLAREYLHAHPSHFRSVRWFGGQLPTFLSKAEAWRSSALVVEMAQLDWKLSLALDAADLPALKLDHLAGLAPDEWPSLTFRLQPAVAKLDLRWNMPAIRNALMAEESVPDPVAGEHLTAWLIWRGSLNARFRSLPVHEAWALDAVRAGSDFAGICEGLGEWIDPSNAAMEAATLLKRWVVDELLLAPTAELES